MRKLIYHVATSLDNFIADEDGSAGGFLPEGPHVKEYLDSLKNYDTVLMGRKTYEFGYEFGLKPGKAPYPHMRNYVFSGTLAFGEQEENVFVIKEKPLDLVRQLKNEKGTTIYLCGGGDFAGFLLKHQLIDTLILKHNPVIFGRGIPLFGKFKVPVELILKQSKVYENGVLLLTYNLKY